MPFVPPLCNCCDYIEATLCAGNPHDTEGWPRLFVKAGGIPAGGAYFSYWCRCYYVDPGDPQGPVPQGANSLLSVSASYANCSECNDAAEECGSNGGGWGGIPGWGGGANPRGYQASVCAGYDDPGYDLWVAPLEVVNGMYQIAVGTFVFAYGGRCWSVTVGENEEPEEITYDWSHRWTWITSWMDSCSDCEAGIPAFICGGQEFEQADPVWIRAAHLPSLSGSFRYRGICYYINVNAPGGIIPENAATPRLSDADMFATCDDCVGGIEAVLCPGQADTQYAPPVWVPVSSLGGITETIYFRQGGFCYSLDPEDELSQRQSNAIVFDPCGSDFVGCAACLCGLPSTGQGIQARVCNGQHDAPIAQDIWVEECFVIPGTVKIFRGPDGICRAVDGDDPLATIPPGVLLMNPPAQYEDCAECVGDRGGEEEECPPGQIWDGVKCVPEDQPCSPGFHLDENGKCVPDENPPTCPPGQHFVEGIGCVDDGEEPTVCPDGYWWNPVKQICERIRINPPTPPTPPPWPPPPPPNPTGKACRALSCEEGGGEILLPASACLHRSIAKVGGTCYRPWEMVDGSSGAIVDAYYYSCADCAGRCYFRWTQRYTCSTASWGAVTEAGSQCATENPYGPNADLDQWIRISGDQTSGYCEYEFVRRVDAPCYGNDDCATFPAAPVGQSGVPQDCCWTCCLDGDCCFSNKSQVSITYEVKFCPYTGPGCTGTLISTPPGPSVSGEKWSDTLPRAATCGRWSKSVTVTPHKPKTAPAGPDDATACGQWSSSTFSAVRTVEYMGSGTWRVNGTDYTGGTCCGITINTSVCTGTHLSTAYVALFVTNNECCKSGSTCVENFGSCSGACPPLPP